MASAAKITAAIASPRTTAVRKPPSFGGDQLSCPRSTNFNQTTGTRTSQSLPATAMIFARHRVRPPKERHRDDALRRHEQRQGEQGFFGIGAQNILQLRCKV